MYMYSNILTDTLFSSILNSLSNTIVLWSTKSNTRVPSGTFSIDLLCDGCAFLWMDRQWLDSFPIGFHLYWGISVSSDQMLYKSVFVFISSVTRRSTGPHGVRWMSKYLGPFWLSKRAAVLCIYQPFRSSGICWCFSSSCGCLVLGLPF